MNHVKGFHEARRLPIGNLPQLKGQNGRLTSKLSRLDHQRGLLERQLAVWTEKQRLTLGRLALLEKQIADIVQLMRKHRTAKQSAGWLKRRAATRSNRQQIFDGATAPTGRQHNVSVEY
jgi:hypothetical protein